MAAKHSYGNMGEFDQVVENWESYIERMEQYFVANDVTSAAKKSNFIEHVWTVDVHNYSQPSSTR